MGYAEYLFLNQSKNLFFSKGSISDRKYPLSICLDNHNLNPRMLKYCAWALPNFPKYNAKNPQKMYQPETQVQDN